MAEVSFSFAQHDDRELLITMMRQLREDDPSDVAFDQAAARRAVPELIENPALGQIWVIRDADSAVGYMAMTMSYSLEFGGPVAFLDELFIAASHRRRGIGEAAIRTVELMARKRGVQALLIEVGPANAPARSLYRRCGFADREYRTMIRPLD